jgi:2-oxoisovalerate dehydrogenase E1 component
MPKSLLVDPAVVRRSDSLRFAKVAVNPPPTSVAEHRNTLGDQGLVSLLRDMLLIREFETMLDGVKRNGRYRDIEYRHMGPAHLSLGQEAAAVGQAAGLELDDHIFGSHRSHGEVIAKAMTAIRQMSDSDLETMMEQFRGGVVLRSIEDALDELATSRAEDFFLYGFLAEIFARRTGFNLGMSGSMHAFFTPFGIFPNNAIVGASAPIAAGAGLFKRVNRKPGIAVANIGDASTGCGPVWESMNFAAMGQFRQLFEEGTRGGLPVLFFFVNNFYGMGGQTIGETMGYERLSRIGAGVNRQSMHAQTIDGNNPLAVREAVQRAKLALSAGEGPALLDCQTYRYSGHSTSDPGSYRTPQEIEMWKAIDPIASFASSLIDEGILDSDAFEQLTSWASSKVEKALKLASDYERSPLLDLSNDTAALSGMTFGHTTIDLADAPPAETSVPPAEASRVGQLAKKSRCGLLDGKRLSGAKAITYREALFEAVFEHATRDGRLVIYGEENRDWDGAFGVYRGLTEVLPYHRLFNAPISEAAIVGSAVGYGMEGGRALVELMYADFIGRAGDEIFNQLAKWRAMSGGLMDMPVVLRISVGARYGAQHSQDWSALPGHVPGLKVVYPATPYDAKGLMAEALSSNDPVVFFESQRSYDDVETYRSEGVPREYYRIPIGEPARVRAGEDLTLLSIGPVLGRCIEAAAQLEEREGWSVDVIDARSLVPFNPELVLESLSRTGRLVVVTDACARNSHASSLAQQLQVLAFDLLDAPAVVVGARNWVSPPLELEDHFFPSVESIINHVSELIYPLTSHSDRAHRDVLDQLASQMARGI